MKHLYLIILCFGMCTISAQDYFSYQAVIRNSNGDLLASKTVSLRLSILLGSGTGSPVYTEVHNATTNENGLLSVLVGNGGSKTGNMGSAKWGSSSYFIKTEVDPNNGSNYSIVGSSPILPIPYALKAREVEIAPELDQLSNVSISALNQGDILSYNGQNWVNTPLSQSTGVKGSGQERYLAFWEEPNKLSTSKIYQSSGGGLFINNPNNDAAALSVRSDGGYGINGESTFVGVFGSGAYGVYGSGSQYGVVAQGPTALRVDGDAIFRNSSGSTELIIEGWNGGNSITSQGDLYVGTFGTMVLNGGGNPIGIGTNAPNAKLTVNGTASKPGGGSWATFSDARLKKDVTPFSDGLSTLLKIKPVNFKYNELTDHKSEEKYVGVLAQELKEVAPFMVSVSSSDKRSDDYLMVDPSAFTYILINSVKEQQAQMDELIKQKNEEVGKLMERIEKLELLMSKIDK
jgi:hypothetical protein